MREGERIEGPAVALEDIRDVREFARWRARAALGANGQLDPIQREDAAEEALVLIYDLYARWDPARCERFSAFCMTYLDRALITWWRRELRQSGRGSWSGSSGSYVYFGTVSLDDLLAGVDDDGPEEARTPAALTSPGID